MNNYHTHTYRGLHAFGKEEEYVQEAIGHHMEELGFSDHGPFPHHDYGLRMPYNDLEDYLQTIDRLQEKYRDHIRLYKGLEIEYYRESLDYYRELLADRGLDYLALGAHTFIDGKGSFKNIFFADSTEDFLSYADNVCEAMRTGCFRFVAHPDLFFLNDFPMDDNTEEACRRIISCAKEQEMILEFNANGYRRSRRMYADGLRHPYPHLYFWQQAAQTDIRVIVGSDCHTPQQVCDNDVLFAHKEVQRLGLHEIESIFGGDCVE